MVSIIIPVYNVEKYLRTCLDSVVNQSVDDYELICVNDGSTDNSLEILIEYAGKYPQIQIIDIENGGTAWARNHGIEAANGEYIWFVDSDDWILENSLEVLKEAIKNSETDIICFNGCLKHEDTGVEEIDPGIHDSVLSGWNYYNKYAHISRKFNFVCVVLRLYKREFLHKHKLYFQKGISHEDNLWIPIVMYYAQSVSFITDCLYVYRIREGSKMHYVNENKFFDLVRINNILVSFFVLKVNEIDTGTIFREISISFMHLINMIHEWKMNHLLKEINSEIDWKLTKETMIDPDLKILFYLIKKGRYKLFYQLYYFDFYVVRKRLRKLKII